MQNLARICVQRPVFATVIILMLVVVGLFAIPALPIDRFPTIDFPAVTVTTVLPGATPEEMDTEVTEEIEKQVGSVSGIDTITSTSAEGISVTRVQFVLEKDGDVGAQEVRAKIDLAMPNLPTATERPIVQKFGADASPIYQFILSGDSTIRDLTEYADKTLRPQLESINGVGEVRILGGKARQINVLVDPYKLRSFGLTILDVRNALNTGNQQVPGGSLEAGDRKISVRTQGRARSMNELRSIVVRTTDDGRAIRIGDVATIEDGEEEPTSAASISGRAAVLLLVRKQSGANSVGVIDLVKAKMKEIKPTLPPSYDFKVTNDQSEFAKAAVHAVEEHLILGSILAALVVLIFLWNWRSTLISALAIPSSIIATFALMWAKGFTLNVITLLALTLAVGIVIDDAIIVLENIVKFIEEKRMTPRQAAIEASKEISLAVLATTLSLVAVFLPVAFMTGIVGRFLNSFGLTMAFAIGVSFLVAFTLTPMLSSRWLKAPKETIDAIKEGKGFKGNVVPERTAEGDHSNGHGDHGAHGGAKKGFDLLGPLENAYSAIVLWALKHRWVVVLATIAVFFSIVPLIGMVPKNFTPDEDESQFIVSVRAREDRSLEATQRLLEEMATDLRKLPEVRETVVTVGNDLQQTANKGEILVLMNDMKDRKSKEDQFTLINRARKEIVPKYPRDLRTLVTPPNAFGQSAQGSLQYVISGPDLKVLAEAANKVTEAMRKIPGVADVDTSLVVGKPELGVTVDRDRAGDLGVSVADVATSLRMISAGDDVSAYSEGGERYDVNVRALPQYRNSQASLDLFTVPTSKGQQGGGSGGQRWVDLSQVVRYEMDNVPSTVERYGRRRSVTISANPMPGTSEASIQAEIVKTLNGLNLGPQYHGEFVGRSRELGKSFSAFGAAFLLSLVFMYLILAAQFESWTHPITILLSLPLTVPFALVSLLITGNSLNIYSMLGLLVLFGIVKKNSILQVDHANQLRERGMERTAAIVQACKDRLRPILMTTIAFVAGMLPLALSSGIGAGTNRAASGIIIGGQILSLALTLIATPVTYSILDDITLMAGKIRTRLFGKDEDEEILRQADAETYGGGVHGTDSNGTATNGTAPGGPDPSQSNVAAADKPEKR